jgi:DNA primase
MRPLALWAARGGWLVLNSGDDAKLAVQQATDLVALIGEQVRLTPKGREFVGLCPFHDDHKPSMFVSPQKQIYKCFSCGAGGDAFSFVMDYHKMSFVEALRHLAQRAGIELRATRDGAEQREQRDQRQAVADANAAALRFYRAILRHTEHGREARAYLQRRGVSEAMIELFQLGCAPDRWDGLAVTVKDKGLRLGDFEAAGLLGSRQDASHFDKLRHRLIFPILDSLNRPIGFGGRRLREEDEPKYLNSPETVLFDKSSTLYGLHAAKKPIIDQRVAVVVEGYTDVIAAHQAGRGNVVATLGTALTARHAQELRRYGDKVVLVFDGDEAGMKAADRGLEIFITQQIDVAIAVIPDGLDPDELLKQADGPARWDACIAAATDALSYQFRRFRAQLDADDTMTGRQRLAEGYLAKLAELGVERQSPIRRAMLVEQLADLLGMSGQQVSDILAASAPRRRAAKASSASGVPSSSAAAGTGPQGGDEPADMALDRDAAEPRITGLVAAERLLLGCLIRRPELLHRPLADGRELFESIGPMDLVTDGGRRLYARLCRHVEAGEQVTLPRLVLELVSAGQKDLIALATEAEIEAERQSDAQDDRLMVLLQNVAHTLLDHQRSAQYRREVRAVLSDQDQQGDQKARLAWQLLEHHRDHPSPTRLPRVRR